MKNLFACLALLFTTAMSAFGPVPQAENPNPPDQIVKLIFIHHSTGENWLTDGYGDLGRTLSQNNYFVSDTNYGWGPDSIGDRTDIPNWLEWFRSDQTTRYMQAVFNESGQNSSYSRTVADPGGENEIIMFKSCFPNSSLEGNSNDAPSADGWLTVGHAKYVYNELLQYFATRPDKLFVVITAPPLSDATYADNARAFNNWLVNDWLRENNYTNNNVAVFDFYNVLTSPDNHHQWANGKIEHVISSGRNTTYYPTGDDHPSVAGSRKATTEFIPLLNIFYRRWKSSAPSAPVVAATAAPTGEQPTNQIAPPASPGSILDDFETGVAAWEPFRDDTGGTTITCTAASDAPHGGVQSMQLDFNIAANGWVTCARFFSEPQNWNSFSGLRFYLRAEQTSHTMHIDLYAGPDTQRETYVYSFETSTDQAWTPIELHWSDFLRVAWEENAGTPFDNTRPASGMAFGFPAGESTANAGKVWVDDLELLGEQPGTSLPESTQTPPGQPAQPTIQPTQPAPAKQQGRLPICGGALTLPVGIIYVLWLVGRKRH